MVVEVDEGMTFAKLFQHCHFGNHIFVHGVFWGLFFTVTFIATIYYKFEEAAEKEKAMKEAKASAKQAPPKETQ